MGEVQRGTLEYKGRSRHVWLKGRTLTIAKTKADTEEDTEVLIAFNIAGASVERDDVFRKWICEQSAVAPVLARSANTHT